MHTSIKAGRRSIWRDLVFTSGDCCSSLKPGPEHNPLAIKAVRKICKADRKIRKDSGRGFVYAWGT